MKKNGIKPSKIELLRRMLSADASTHSSRKPSLPKLKFLEKPLDEELEDEWWPAPEEVGTASDQEDD